MFLDANFLVYALFDDAPDQGRARDLMYGILIGMESGSIQPVISRQVIREFTSAATRPQPGSQSSLMSPEQALDRARLYADTFEVLDETLEVTRRLFALCQEMPVRGKDVHDANIVATMLAYGESKILTFGIDDFKPYADRGHIKLVLSSKE